MPRAPSERRLDAVQNHIYWAMATRGRGRLPTRVLDPCRAEEEREVFQGEEGDKEEEEDTYLILDTYAWVGEARRNRDVMSWLKICGGNHGWSRAQRNTFHMLVKGLKHTTLQPSRYIENWPNEVLAVVDIMNVRVLQRNTSWVFYSLSEWQVHMKSDVHVWSWKAMRRRRHRLEWDAVEFLRIVRDTRGVRDPPPPYTPWAERDREDCVSETTVDLRCVELQTQLEA
ncbi:hypothetical protein ACJ41O_005448 [Fusarium nematophilum]